ncbi:MULTISPECIES: GNAT family N-acetyltransferase [Sulfurimonas]|uniref:GNAT family N-acetyltransferase n=1 Tax=Sulfurimonas diazotrophicus TaxID=3131939 RepID=A0ABZ3H7C7_9BACT
MPYRVIDVNRKEYFDSIAQIDDAKSRGFADQAMRWWDRHYSWNAEGSVILTDDAGEHLCYLFYKIDRYHDYLTIHNILTPQCHRRHGYALMLLHWVFELAVQHHVRRFKASCVPQALEFYLSLGFCFWGLTPAKYYYCNLPVPADGLDGLWKMVHTDSTETLAGSAMQSIYDKVADNDTGLDAHQQERHDEQVAKLQGAYMQTELIACMEEAKDHDKANQPGK